MRGAMDFGERVVIITFEGNAEELTANLRSLGFDLAQLTALKRIVIDWVHTNSSEFEEPGELDLEGLFIRPGNVIDLIGAKCVVLDTVEALFAGPPNESVLRVELRRLFRWLKDRGIPAVITGEKGDGTLSRHGLEEYVADCLISLDHHMTAQISTRRLRVIKYLDFAHGTNEYPFLIG